MPSQYFPQQSVLFSVGLQGHYWVIGASGTYLLPYLRACQARTHTTPDIRLLLNHPDHLDPTSLHRWIGTIYVEYAQPEDLIVNPARLECAGQIHTPTPYEISAYLFPTTDPLIGPI